MFNSKGPGGLLASCVSFKGLTLLSAAISIHFLWDISMETSVGRYYQTCFLFNSANSCHYFGLGEKCRYLKRVMLDIKGPGGHAPCVIFKGLILVCLFMRSSCQSYSCQTRPMSAAVSKSVCPPGLETAATVWDLETTQDWPYEWCTYLMDQDSFLF